VVAGERPRAVLLQGHGAARHGVIAMTVQRKRGRPSDYCAEIAMTICDRLADGESLRAICAGDGMPNKATVFRWIGRHKDFRDQYAVAREVQADDILDEILEIAHDDSRDHVKKVGADGKVTWVVDHENIARCQLKINALFRIVAQLAPRKYGNRR
jgi:Bacteriophage Sf6, terminase small subunit-like